MSLGECPQFALLNARLLWHIRKSMAPGGRVVAGKLAKEKSLAALPALWRFAAVSDFDNDGVPELVARNAATGVIAYFTQTQPNLPVVIDGAASAHQLMGIADIDRDLEADLIYQDTATGAVFAKRRVKGVVGASLPLITLPPGFSVAGVADYDGDAYPDLLTFNKATGANAIEFFVDAKPVRRARIGLSPDWYPKN